MSARAARDLTNCPLETALTRPSKRNQEVNVNSPHRHHHHEKNGRACPGSEKRRAVKVDALTGYTAAHPRLYQLGRCPEPP
ncbi:hypothetical protein BR93DRAFT_924096 [Coniochaeta sp. PMI_546]|nr:hypothetical protein BR93DRAFT_924096 [Coniochaeta sp. PMI_546]